MSSAPKVLFLTFGVLLFAGREMPVIALYAGNMPENAQKDTTVE